METFTHYWRSLSAAEKGRLANQLDTSTNYLAQIAGGHRNAGGKVLRAATEKRSDLIPLLVGQAGG